MELRSYLETAPIPQLGHNSFRHCLESGFSIHGKSTGSVTLFTPTADSRPYSPFDGGNLNVWFDRTPQFLTKGLNDIEDHIGVNKSLEKIEKLILDIEGNYDNIFIGGFSMGGGLALHFLHRPISPKIKGIFSLGSFLVDSSSLFQEPSHRLALHIPVLMMHGKADSMIKLDFGQKTAANMLLHNIDVQFRSYDHVDHEISAEELRDLLYWMEDVLCTRQQVAESKTEAMNNEDNHSKKSCEDDASSADGKIGSMDVDHTSSKASYVSPLTTLSASSTHEDESEKKEQPKDCLPYQIEQVSSSSSSFVIHFAVAVDSIELLTARPVMACGSEFLIVPDEKKGVKVAAITSDPHKTAVEVGRRLWFRLKGDSNGLNPCPMS